MSRRIEIELTSKQDNSVWTWRAAGAKQPKGTLAAEVLYDDAKVGDVVRAEAEFEIDGITILSVQRPTKKTETTGNRIDVTGPQRKFEPVTSQLAPKSGRNDRKNPRSARDPLGRDPGARKGRERSGDTRGSDRDEKRRPAKSSARGERPAQQRRERPQAPAFKKLIPGDTHRMKVLEQVPAEQRPIAEKVLRGGIPSVRQAIEAENAAAKAAGRPEVNSEGLLDLAEQLLPQLKSAEWLDRAVAAKASVDEISVRDLRAVVAAADAGARGEESRLLAAELRDALTRRSQQARDTWNKELLTALDEGRVLRALNLSARPPDADTKFPSDVGDRLKSAAEEALSPETRQDHWIRLLDALSKSPVRRSVEKIALPTSPSEALVAAAKEAVGRVPALSAVLGVSMPPPPRKRIPPKPSVPAKPAFESPADSKVAEQPSAGPVSPEVPVHDDQPGDET